jgi:hypothetical protein
MKNQEVVLNIFLIISREYGIIEELRATTHMMHGTDQKKLKLLQKKVAKDLRQSVGYNIPQSHQIVDEDGNLQSGKILHDRFKGLYASGDYMIVLEDIFLKNNAGKTPLMVITTVVDGKIRVDLESPLNNVVYLKAS